MPPPSFASPASSGPVRRRGSAGVGTVVAASLLSAVLASGGTVLLLDQTGALDRPAAATTAGNGQQTGSQQPVSIDESSAVIDAAAKVGPAVVKITAAGQSSDPFGNVPTEGVGSGFIYDASGWILTNRHVVADASTLVVELKDGRRFDGRVYGIDTLTDLAIVKVDAMGLPTAPGHGTAERARQALTGQLPVSVFARIQGMTLSVVDAGVAERLPPHERLLMRKIAHGTRNARVGAAMSVDQAQAAIRAGMEIGESLPGNLLACAGIGVGGHESAALVLSRLAGAPVRELLQDRPDMDPNRLTHLLVITQAAQGRHRDVTDPVEVLAAFGGFEIAMMVGVMLVAAGRRHLVMVDGLPACAALMVAARIAASVTDYCVFCRSHSHNGLDYALNMFHTSAVLELGMECTDGTGATLAWPLVRAACALLSEVAEGEDPGPTRPGSIDSQMGALSSGLG